MKLVLEVTGGFTGKAGKQVISLDLDQLPEGVASEMHRLLEAVPPSVWGESYLSNHPKPWDFRHELSVRDGEQRMVTFHKGQGPSELTTLAERIVDYDSSKSG